VARAAAFPMLRVVGRFRRLRPGAPHALTLPSCHEAQRQPWCTPTRAIYHSSLSLCLDRYVSPAAGPPCGAAGLRRDGISRAPKVLHAAKRSHPTDARASICQDTALDLASCSCSAASLPLEAPDGAAALAYVCTCTCFSEMLFQWTAGCRR
jgi:hypothetical protein